MKSRTELELKIAAVKLEIKHIRDSQFNCKPNPAVRDYGSIRETNFIHVMDLEEELFALRNELKSVA
jgi:hypothetical protein